jgi:crotonobetainyl-CoA:carnitine CoA-transferase CaiB-like acyl-CoA transferase
MNPPLWNRTTMIDYTGALLGASAILHALLVRARTGVGAELHVPLVNAGIFLLSELIQHPDGSFVGAPQVNRYRTGFHPAEQMYRTADGWIALAVRGKEAARRLAEILRCDRLREPLQSWGECESELIASALRDIPSDDILATLKNARIWAEKCSHSRASEALSDPALIARGTVHLSEHPQFGAMREFGSLFRLESSPVASSSHTPLPGEHTRAVLAELGYEAAEIETLAMQCIVG